MAGEDGSQRDAKDPGYVGRSHLRMDVIVARRIVTIYKRFA